MELLRGKYLLNCEGKLVPAERAYKKKIMLAFYFSEAICDPCERLLPKVKRIYQENMKRKSGLEIIYIGVDKDEDTFKSFFKHTHPGWYATPFESVIGIELRNFFDVTNIPQIYVVRTEDGAIITRNGRAEVERLGTNVLVVWSCA